MLHNQADTTMTRILTVLLIILISQATAEWVEISQQHYRKPIRTYTHFTTPDKVIDVEDTTKRWSYNNRSVTEYNWNKPPARPPKIGVNIKRVQDTVKTTERFKEDDDDLDLHVDFKDFVRKPNYDPTRPNVELHDLGKQKGTIERVPNVASIKRVQLNNSPVKSPALNFKGDEENYSNSRYESGSRDGEREDHVAETNVFDYKRNKETFHRRIYVNNVKNHGTERTATFSSDDHTFPEVTTFITEKPKQEYKNLTIRDYYSTKPTFITETDDFTNYETQQNRFYKITNTKSSEVTERSKVFTTDTINTEEDIATKTNAKLVRPTTAKVNKNNVYKNGNDFKAESHENKVHDIRNDEKETNSFTNIHKNDNHDQSKHKNQSKNKHEKEIDKEIKDEGSELPTSAKTEKNKLKTMENVIKFMRVVADTISKNSRRSFSGKMQYLHELKDSILANIKERIDAAWPDDSAGTRRRSRSAHASSRGHVQFPSSESALMTISFLTFAVFLIKLVLQVIQTYKNKALMVAPLMVASARNVFTHQHPGHH